VSCAHEHPHLAWLAGVPCWVDISVPDVRASSSFYSTLLGWHVAEPDEQYGGYVVADVAGAAAAGIGPEQPGAPTAWTVYLATDDAEATAARVTAHGGTVVVPPLEVGPMGRMAVASDPSGAFFGLWQAGTMIGAEWVNEPGGLVWEDLRSTDPARAQEFYRGVFGYRLDPLEMAGPGYATFALPDEPAPLGGMGGLMGLPDGTPSHWLVYFAVADTDLAVAAAQGAGGRVVAPAFDTEFGRMAGLADPDGAVFMVMEVDPTQPAPDRSG